MWSELHTFDCASVDDKLFVACLKCDSSQERLEVVKFRGCASLQLINFIYHMARSKFDQVCSRLRLQIGRMRCRRKAVEMRSTAKLKSKCASCEHTQSTILGYLDPFLRSQRQRLAWQLSRY